ncbi:MAG: hypothetical protein OEZ10_11445 [Gammaproteobacteria bacterium]|nr:hypothetical protein [Gammaproteobacteria bacterium]
MYTDEDLEGAVKEGIFTQDSVTQFRSFMASKADVRPADEENIRLVNSFSDIFVVVACALLIFSTAWVTHGLSQTISMLLVVALSWGLAEFFVLRRNMALPAIVLLVSYAGGTFSLVLSLFVIPSEPAIMLAGLVSSVATWLHWKRFKVPITVAAGTAAAIVFLVAAMLSVFPALKVHINLLTFLAGLGVFYVAMYWDSADVERVTRKSDVAFWLHLAAAPLIVHPIFTNLGILKGNQGVSAIVIVVVLYVLLSVVSLVIDRRAFMVSSLIYVLYALTQLFEMYGLAGDSFAYVGVIIGSSLLMLSGFWGQARRVVYQWLPAYVQGKVPGV